MAENTAKDTTSGNGKDPIKGQVKSAVRGCYDIQKLRIQTGNRIVANFRVKLGIAPSKKSKTDKEADKLLARVRKHYQLITEGLIKLPPPKKFKAEGVIDDYTELVLVNQYEQILLVEKSAFINLETLLETTDLWNNWLKDIKGIGPRIAGVILSEIDIATAKYPSSIWKYAGLDVAEDGKGRSRRKEHLIEVEYLDKNNELKKKMSITFNPFLKTKLIGVLGPSFLRAKGPYSEIYYNYKTRLENHIDHKEKSKGHRHNMAIRYMVKMFLRDLYVKWRTMEKLPVAPDYATAKLGYSHSEAKTAA